MVSDINFPNVWTRIFSASVHYVGSCLLTFVLARRTAFENLDTLRGWRELGAAKLSVILAFADSLLFLLLTGILTHGAGLELSHAACSTAFFACVFLYASSKVFIYNFLTERVWVVWSSTCLTSQPKRWRSPLYLSCIASESLYSVVVTLALCMGITESGFKCYIGLHLQASLLLLAYDCYMNILLTGLFVYPLWKQSILSKRLRKMAIRTLLAALVALTTSTANIAVLSHFRGRERAWLCLLCCSTDVAVNSLVIYTVTRSRRVRRWRGYQGRVSTKGAQQDTYAEEHRPRGRYPSQQVIDDGRSGGVGIDAGGLRSIVWTTHDKDQGTSLRLQFPSHTPSVNGDDLISEKSQEAAHYGGSRISISTRRRHHVSLEHEDDKAKGDGDFGSRDLESRDRSTRRKDDDYAHDTYDHDIDDEIEDEDEDEDEDEYEDGEDYITVAQRQRRPKPGRRQGSVVSTPHPRRSIDSAASSVYSLSSGYTTYNVYRDDPTTACTPDTSAPPTTPSPCRPSLSSTLSDSPELSQTHAQVPPFPPSSVHDVDLALARGNSCIGTCLDGTFSPLPPPPPSHRPLHPSSSYPPPSLRATSSHPNVPSARIVRSRTRNREREPERPTYELDVIDTERGSGPAPEPSSYKEGRPRLLSLTEALAELDYRLPSPASAVVSRFSSPLGRIPRPKPKPKVPP